MPTRSSLKPRDQAAVAGPADEQKALIEEVLRILSPEDREVLQRYFVREQRPEQICAEMGITDTQFRLIKSRAKNKVAALIQAPRRRGPGKAATMRPGSRANIAALDRAIPTVAHAISVFGDERKAAHWLQTPLALIGNRSPAQVLSAGDTKTVDVILTRIEHNIPS